MDLGSSLSIEFFFFFLSKKVGQREFYTVHLITTPSANHHLPPTIPQTRVLDQDGHSLGLGSVPLASSIASPFPAGYSPPCVMIKYLFPSLLTGNPAPLFILPFCSSLIVESLMWFSRSTLPKIFRRSLARSRHRLPANPTPRYLMAPRRTHLHFFPCYCGALTLVFFILFIF